MRRLCHPLGPARAPPARRRGPLGASPRPAAPRRPLGACGPAVAPFAGGVLPPALWARLPRGAGARCSGARAPRASPLRGLVAPARPAGGWAGLRGRAAGAGPALRPLRPPCGGGRPCGSPGGARPRCVAARAPSRAPGALRPPAGPAGPPCALPPWARGPRQRRGFFGPRAPTSLGVPGRRRRRCVGGKKREVRNLLKRFRTSLRGFCFEEGNVSNIPGRATLAGVAPCGSDAAPAPGRHIDPRTPHLRELNKTSIILLSSLLPQKRTLQQNIRFCRVPHRNLFAPTLPPPSGPCQFPIYRARRRRPFAVSNLSAIA